MSVGLVFVIGYLIGMRWVGRRYFLRRHGVVFEMFGVGTLTATMVGLLWPITLALPRVRNPELCIHQAHARNRALSMQEIRTTEELRRSRG